MSRQYTNGFEFEVTGSQATCVELPAPPRGTLERMIIKQVGGTDGFDCLVLDRKDACASVAEVSNSFEPDTPEGENKLLDPDLHRIIDSISIAGGTGIYEGFNLNAGYQNRDEQDIRRTPNSRIYLDLTPGGSGSKTYQVAYTVEPMTNA
jgi:hypothetical protein